MVVDRLELIYTPRSRAKRSVVNDADRLRKYLHEFGLSLETVSAT